MSRPGRARHQPDGPGVGHHFDRFARVVQHQVADYRWFERDQRLAVSYLAAVSSSTVPMGVRCGAHHRSAAQSDSAGTVSVHPNGNGRPQVTDWPLPGKRSAQLAGPWSRRSCRHRVRHVVER